MAGNFADKIIKVGNKECKHYICPQCRSDKNKVLGTLGKREFAFLITHTIECNNCGCIWEHYEEENK